MQQILKLRHLNPTTLSCKETSRLGPVYPRCLLQELGKAKHKAGAERKASSSELLKNVPAPEPKGPKPKGPKALSPKALSPKALVDLFYALPRRVQRGGLRIKVRVGLSTRNMLRNH